MALTLKEQRENVRVIAESRNLTIYAAVKVWAQATELLRDRVVTISNLGASGGDRLELSREIDRSWYDLLVRDAKGAHLACLNAHAFAADFVFEAGNWRLVTWYRGPKPEVVDMPEAPELVPRMLTREELAVIAEARSALWPLDTAESELLAQVPGFLPIEPAPAAAAE